ncbi:MAG: polysaccharide biosynthesis C-terminal domain-containing protein [Vicingaceae bacterium]
MTPLKKLAGQTAIYGLPSIVGRLLNYLLVPLHTGVFLPERFGVITEMYAYVAFLVVLLTYGMETAYFRFQSKEGAVHKNVFSTTLLSLVFSTLIFWTLTSLFSQSIANAIHYPDNSEFVVWFAFIVGMDAISSIPMARLRVEGKAIKFALINFANILVNIGLNLFWLAYCIPNFEAGNSNALIDLLYTPEIGVGYVFIANLIASGVKFLLLSPYFLKLKFVVDRHLLKQMLIYAGPLLISSLAIIVNESADKILIKWLLVDDLGVDAATEKVGIYGACYKLSIIISLFIQAFRYAAEPFFFSQEKEKNSKAVYATIMNYFVLVCATIFLGVMLYLDILKHFLADSSYWEGLHIVPILLFANIFLGIFYNLSVWYKLSGKTKYGAYIASFGALITLVLNLVLIPKIGYTGSAWATLVCYASMVLVSYYLGKKHFPVPYNMKKVVGYLSLAFLVYVGSTFFAFESELFKYAIHTLILLAFIGLAFVLEKPKKAIIS